MGKLNKKMDTTEKEVENQIAVEKKETKIILNEI